MSIGKTISELRRAAGLTQTALAEKLGVTEQSVSKWETEVCTPDVSLFPLIAAVFDCSIDRVFGVETDTYRHGVDAIVTGQRECRTLEEEIRYLLAALTRYPGSVELQLRLSKAYLCAFRMAESQPERERAFKNAVEYARRVLARSKNRAERDRAGDLLVQIYTENGNFEEALQACEELSADRAWQRMTGKAAILYESKRYEELYAFAQRALYDAFATMQEMCGYYVRGLQESGETERAREILLLQERVLSLFDVGGADFYAVEKMFAAHQKACLCKKENDREAVLSALNEMVEHAKQVIAKGANPSVSDNRLLPTVGGKEACMAQADVKQFVNAMLEKNFRGYIAESELNDFWT